MNLSLSWLPQYSVGHEHLDKQHQELLAAGDDLHALLDQKLSKHDFEAVLFEKVALFLNLIKCHFKDEESLMAEAKYPDIDHHISCHNDCIDFFNALLADDGSISARAKHIQTNITHWVIHHVVYEDSKYIEFL